MQDNELQRVPEDAELDALDLDLSDRCACEVGLQCEQCDRRLALHALRRRVDELEKDRERLWEFARDHCPSCDGVGYCSAPAHHPSCDGSCSQCPVEKQMQCDCEGVIRSYMDTLSGLKIDAARADEPSIATREPREEKP